MKFIPSFLCKIAGYSNECLKDAPEDEIVSLQNIGRSIFLTTLFAFITGSIFISQTNISNNPLLVSALGLLWAFAIFSLDRFSISIIEPSKSLIENVIRVSPRLLLSLAIALLIAAPVHVALFSNDITKEITDLKNIERKEAGNTKKQKIKDADAEYNKAKENLDLKKEKENEESEYNRFKGIIETLELENKDLRKDIYKECRNPENRNIMGICEDRQNKLDANIEYIKSNQTHLDDHVKNLTEKDNERINYAQEQQIQSINRADELYKENIKRINAPYSIFKKEEILFTKSLENFWLLIGLLSVIIVFWVIDFYPVIAKLTNPTKIYDYCKKSKKNSYQFKTRLSSKLDKYLSLKLYKNEKDSINDNDVWDYTSKVEKDIFKEIYEHYGDKVKDISKEKIDEWSTSFSKKPIKNGEIIEKLFYEYFYKSLHGKNHLSTSKINSQYQYGFALLPDLIQISVIMLSIYAALMFVNGGMNTLYSVIETIAVITTLFEIYKFILSKINPNFLLSKSISHNTTQVKANK